MTSFDRKAHWEAVYETKGEREVSWFQDDPAPSLDLIALTGATPSSAIIDIGGGASRLVDALLARGFTNMTVLDLSAAALAAAQARLGAAAAGVTWIVADATTWQPTAQYDVWHDRAAFHFLNAPEEQAAYVARLRGALKIGGHAIIGTFALDSRRHQHATPWQSVQNFQFSTFRRIR